MILLISPQSARSPCFSQTSPGWPPPSFLEYGLSPTSPSVPLVLTVCVQASAFYSKLDVTPERSHGFFPCVLSWTKNSLDQDQCIVGAMLNASCLGLGKSTLSPYSRCVIDDGVSRIRYPPPNSVQYHLPSRTNNSLKCRCNTVMYRYEGLGFFGVILCRFIS